MESTSLTKKSLLNSNEKVVSAITALALFSGLGWVLYHVLPYVVNILENLIYSIIMLGGIVITTMIIWHNRKMIWVAYQIFVQKLWRALANADPIAIMKIGLKQWRIKHAEIDQQITILEASKVELEKVMSDNQKEATLSFQRAKKSQEMKNEGQANYNSVRANRKMLSNEQFISRLRAVNGVLTFLRKLYERWEYEIDLLKEDIDMKERDLKLVKKTSNALRSAQSLISGDPDDLAMQEIANEVYAEQVSQNVANITQFMERSKQWMFNSDINEAILSDEGEKLLQSYDEASFNQLVDFRKKVDTNTLPVADQNQIKKMGDITLDSFRDLN
jgi:hypothetical protein